MILIAESPSRRTEYRRCLGNAGEKVFEIVQIITEEWAKRTADHDPPVTSVQIVQIAESVIATKMFGNYIDKCRTAERCALPRLAGSVLI